MTDDEILRALGKLAKDQQGEAPPELDELLRPLDGSAQERMAQRALSVLGTPAGAKVLSPAGGWRRVARIALPLAASLALVVMMTRRSSEARLPPYQMTVSGGIQELRAGSEVDRLGPTAKLDILLRPSTRVEGDVAARLFVIEQGRAREWKAAFEVSPDGAIRISALGADLVPVASPELEVVAVVARPTQLPKPSELADASGGRQLFRRTVRWE